MNLEVLIAFIVSSTILTVSPGPDILYVISQSFLKGKKAAIVTSLGLTTGLLLHTFFVVVGLSILIRENENIFLFLKFIGSLYFIYLAIMVFLKRNNKMNFKSKELENIDFFKKGLLMNLLNPKVSLFFIVLFPSFLFHDNLNSQIQFAILGILFWIQATFVFVTVSLFASSLKALVYKDSLFAKNLFWLEIFVYIFISIWIFI